MRVINGLHVENGILFLGIVAVDVLKHVVIVATGSDVARSLPRELEVLGGKRLTIRPLEAIHELVGVDDLAVGLHLALRKRLCTVGNDLVLLAARIQLAKHKLPIVAIFFFVKFYRDTAAKILHL